MKIICDCGQEMSLIPSGKVDEKERIELVHPHHKQEEIEIYEFKKGEKMKHCIAFHCNGCNRLFVFNVEHRD